MDRLSVEDAEQIAESGFLSPAFYNIESGKILMTIGRQLADTMRLSKELVDCLNRQQKNGVGKYTGEVHMALNRLDDCLHPNKDSEKEPS